MGIISFFTFLQDKFLAENERRNNIQASAPLSYQDSFPPMPDEDSPNAWVKTLNLIAHFCGLFFGLCFLVFASYFFLALTTYNQSDPNLDTANGNAVQNMTGILGADISNVLFQFFGVASFLIIVLLVGWGIELIYSGKPGNLVTRALGGIAFLFCGAAFATLFEWIFFHPNGMLVWKEFVPNSSLGGDVGDYFAAKILAMVTGASPPISPQGAVLLIFIGLASLLASGAVAFKMPPHYWVDFGKFLLRIYHHFFPEKKIKRPPRKHAFNDSPFSDLHHPAPPIPDMLKPKQHSEEEAENPWFSTETPASTFPSAPSSDMLQENSQPFEMASTPSISISRAEAIHRSPLPPQAKEPEITISPENHVELAHLPETNDIQQEKKKSETSIFSSLGKYFSNQRKAPISPFEAPSAPEENFIGTPSVRNTYNLHREDIDENDLRYEAFQTNSTGTFDNKFEAPRADMLSQQPYPIQDENKPASAAAAPIAAPAGAPVAQTVAAPLPPQPMTRPEMPTAPQPQRAAAPASPYSSESWVRPSLSLLEDRPANENIPTEEELKELGESLEQVLSEYKIKGKVVAIRRGPVATLFEFRPIAGTRESQIVTLSDDIARSLAVANVRITRVSGRNTVGLEVPNQIRDMVSFVELLNNPTWKSTKGILELALGKNVTGKPVYADLAAMPHLLVAGTTGSGKSVGMNAMLLSLLLRLSPEDCRMILVDPKKLEFSLYEGIPHLLTPVITEADKALGALRWAVGEMERRYQFLADAGVRNIISYNHRAREIRAGRLSNIRTYQSGNDPQTGMPLTETIELPSEHLPYIVIVIDEMADLMMTDGKGKEIEAGVVRLAQKARACGIHLIIATQRPSADVITGLIKANFPSRIAFQVTNKIDSRIVLDAAGGEQLLGNGDMLFRLTGKPIIRLHGPYISEDEVDAVANDLRSKQAPIYNADIAMKMEEAANEESSKGSSDSGSSSANDKDELYEDAVDIIFKHKRATASFLQRQLSIGYNRASKIIEMMEEDGIVGPPTSNGKRDILRRSRPAPDSEEGFLDDGDNFGAEEDMHHEHNPF